MRQGGQEGKESLILSSILIPRLPHALSFGQSLSLSLHVYLYLSLNLHPTSCMTLTCPHRLLCSVTSAACCCRKWLIFKPRRSLTSHQWHQLHPRLSFCVLLFLYTVKLPILSSFPSLLCYYFFHLSDSPTMGLTLQLALLKWYFSRMHPSHVQKVLQRAFWVFQIGFD